MDLQLSKYIKYLSLQLLYEVSYNSFSPVETEKEREEIYLYN